MPFQGQAVCMGGRLDHAGLEQQPARGRDQAIADQDRRLDPGQHASQPPQGTVRGSRPDHYREQRQDSGDGLDCGRSPHREQRRQVPGLPWLAQRDAYRIEQPPAADGPVDADRGISQPDHEPGQRGRHPPPARCAMGDTGPRCMHGLSAFSMPVAVAGGRDAISVRRQRQGRHRPAGRCCRRSGPQRWGRWRSASS